MSHEFGHSCDCRGVLKHAGIPLDARAISVRYSAFAEIPLSVLHRIGYSWSL